MSLTDRSSYSSQATLVNPSAQISHNYQQRRDFVCGFYLIKSSRLSDLECVVSVPDKIPQAANTTEPRQTYKSYLFQIKSGKHNEEYFELDVTKDDPGYILAAGGGDYWHMRTLFDLNDFEKKSIQKFVNFTTEPEHSEFIARHELVKATIRTYNTQKNFLFQYERTYLACVTNTKIISFVLFLTQIPISDHLIKYLICQVRDS